ncbi:MAG: hypothetical protein DBX90_10510 [Lentisphaerae bacterium]|nr:MAG: hypothetical protein DBX90_10510 [Lentisphaerota bacterium]
MKFYFLLLWLGIGMWSTACTGAVIFGSEREQPDLTLYQAEKNGQDYEYKDLKGQIALVIRYFPEKSTHFEFFFHKRFELPEFEQARFRVKVNLSKPTQLSRFSLRLRDRDNEIFQLPCMLTGEEPGERTLEFEVTAEPGIKTWGADEKGNGRLDFPVVLHGFAGDFRRGTKGEGEIGITTVTMECQDKSEPEQPLEVSLETGNPISLLTPNSLGAPQLRFLNRGEKLWTGGIKYTVQDVTGYPIVNNSLELSLLPGESTGLPLAVPERFGVYYADVTVEPQKKAVPPLHRTMQFARLVPAGPTADFSRGFRFGICDHPERYPLAEQKKMALAAALCGVKTFRCDIGWQTMQPRPDRLNFHTFDRIAADYSEQGIELQPIFSFVPSWAVDRNKTLLEPDFKGGWGCPHAEAVREFAKIFTKRYRGKFRYIEIWNEPDLLIFARFSGEDYVELLKNAFLAIRDAAPEVKVMTAGFTRLPGRGRITSDPDVMVKTIRDGKGYYDIFSYHGHGMFWGFANGVLGFQRLQRQYGNVTPFYATETAVSSVNISELLQAETLFKKLIFAWAHGAVGYNWYNLRNKGSDPRNSEHNYGMLTHDFQPKAVYVTYNMLSGTFQEGKYLSEIPMNGKALGYCFKGRDGAILMPLWKETRNLENPLFIFQGVSGRAERIDIFGNISPVAVKNGVILAEAGGQPATYRFPDMEKMPKMAGEFFESDFDWIIYPGKKQIFRGILRNPFPVSRNFDLRLELPEGIRSRSRKIAVTLPGNGTGKIAFPLESDAGFNLIRDDLREAVLKIYASGLEKKLFYPVRSSTSFPSSGFRKEPNFVSDQVEAVKILVPSEPTSAHLVWSGPEDLSFKVWGCHGGDNLKLKVEVRDDIHFQPFSDTAKQPDGDYVQLFLKLPEQDGYWELGMTKSANTSPQVVCRQLPHAFVGHKEKIEQTMKIAFDRDERQKVSVYSLEIPKESIGLDSGKAGVGFLFNIQVSDNDGEGRESLTCPSVDFWDAGQAFPVHLQ